MNQSSPAKPKKSSPFAAAKTEFASAANANGDANGVNNGEPTVKIIKASQEPETAEKEINIQRGVVSSIVRTYGCDFAMGSILKLIHDVLIFISPLFLKKIIAYAACPNEELWKGIIYALGLLIANFGQSIMLSRYFYNMYVIGMWIRASVVSSIYRKSLKISPQGKAESTTGEVVNLMSVDAQRLVDMMVRIELVFHITISYKINREINFFSHTSTCYGVPHFKSPLPFISFGKLWVQVSLLAFW